MMLKITERCSMGCKHCMNNAIDGGKDMSEKVLKDSLNFLKRYDLGRDLIITGGEPTEHSEFDYVLHTILDFSREYNYFRSITITTNGEKIQDNPEQFQGYIKTAKDVGVVLIFQVSADVRYYPRRIKTNKRIFRDEGFVLCDNCVEAIYPQGRALENNIPWKSKASKCFNVRSLSHQLPKSANLSDIEIYLALHGKFCTPHISVTGDIKLGESDLCPKCCSIYEPMTDIMKSIRDFKCNGCEHINKNLPDAYKLLL